MSRFLHGITAAVDCLRWQFCFGIYDAAMGNISLPGSLAADFVCEKFSVNTFNGEDICGMHIIFASFYGIEVLVGEDIVGNLEIFASELNL